MMSISDQTRSAIVKEHAIMVDTRIKVIVGRITHLFLVHIPYDIQLKRILDNKEIKNVSSNLKNPKIRTVNAISE